MLRCWAATGVKGLPVSLPNLAPGWLPASSALLIHDEGPQVFASHLPSSPGGFSPRSESILPHLYPVPRLSITPPSLVSLGAGEEAVRSRERQWWAQGAEAVSSSHYALFNNSFPGRLQAPCSHSGPERANHAQILKLKVMGVWGGAEGW